MKTTTPFIPLFLLFVSAIALHGCGGDDSSGDDSSTQSSSTSTDDDASVKATCEELVEFANECLSIETGCAYDDDALMKSCLANPLSQAALDKSVCGDVVDAACQDSGFAKSCDCSTAK